MSLSPLPIDAVLPEIVRALLAEPNLVVQAPPGAGKTTRVPRALLDAASAAGTSLSAGEILVLEPRRLPARLAARRVASELGEPLGKTVGYTVRFEDVSSKSTRIRFITEGVLTRRLLTDATLRSVSAVVLDELHERHLQGDVALALLRRLQSTKRPDLRLVAMSATLDASHIAEFLGCGVVQSEGKRFDVAIEHLGRPDDRKLELQVASAIRSLLTRGPRGLDGHALVFLPGAAEIRRAINACDKLAREHDLELLPLHGDLSPAEQDRAVGPSPRRKIIVSTNVAESSVTIDGVVAVVDSGLVRVAKHAAWSGLATSSVEKTSRASAVQRAGRAGRTRPGCALRLYTKADFDERPDYDTPEVERADISQVLLELCAMGAKDIAWLDPPKPDAMAAANVLLARLGAVNEQGEITDIGKRMLAFPLHPRQSRLLVEAMARGVAEDGALLAAIIGERDLRAASKTRFDAGPARPHDVATDRSDLLSQLDIYREAEASGFSAGALRSIGLDHASVHATSRAHNQLLSLLRSTNNRESSRANVPAGQAYDDALLLSVLAGFPDRVARRKTQGSRDLVLAEGGRAELAEQSAVRDAPWMVAVSAEVIRGRTLVRVASGMEPEWLIDLFADRIREVCDVTFDEAHDEVRGSSKMLYEDLVIAESPRLDKSDPRVTKLLFDRVRARGFRSLAPEGMLDRFLARARFAATQDATVRALSDEDVAQIVFAMCEGKSRICELREADLLATLRAKVGAWSQMDELSPERLVLTNGRQAIVIYEEGKPPFVKSYLQDFFGMKTGPTIGPRRMPIVLHLLAPNKRAVQITTDLAGFWQRHYPTIRKELMRKYPRHAWPEDTTTPVPMRPAKTR
ncbi:MAG: ATP-dependent helicase HrpB [Polyangiaceae bacterium]|nr:ATP-dependent helicase HrpB [Polyangiaceae bacterium]